MAARAIYDDHLTPLLRDATDEDLEPLVSYVKIPKTSTFGSATQKVNYPDPRLRRADDVVHEVRTFGGNSFLNLGRPSGVPYAEVVRDVASKVDAKVAKDASVEAMELAILVKILDDAVTKMTPQERAALDEEFRKAGVRNPSLSIGAPIAAIMAQAGVQLTGFFTYRVAVIVANAVARALLGRGLSLVGNAALVQALGVFAGPVGWAASAIWTAADLAGPAYRVTIPVVCHVAYLRQKRRFGNLADE